jgi:hypothetical protein
VAPAGEFDSLSNTTHPMEGNTPRNELQRKSSRSAGHKYWRNFCARHEQEIESKKAVRYDSKCDDWYTVSNFERMYDDIYDTMAKAGVPKELNVWEHQDREWNAVSEDYPKRFGRATKHVLTHPE